MSVVIPHSAGAAALAALNAALVTATKPDKAIGQTIADDLSKAIDYWGRLAGVYNSRLLTIGVVSDAVAAANRAASGARAIHPFVEPDISALGGVDAALLRLSAARAGARGVIVKALDEARAELIAARDPQLSPPSDADILALVRAANEFRRYLVAV